MSVCQAGQSSTVIENIHTIIAAAAVKFSFDQLSHLFVLIQKVSAAQSGVVREDVKPKRVCGVAEVFVWYLELGN